ncbi:sensor histidine kinase [Herbiconiux sp. P17]|uniref:sensor histidine kinase n=1 Tax=Herbiconiux wuyangfengii TaxID=3342794 RepID=UPI0035B9CC6B
MTSPARPAPLDSELRVIRLLSIGAAVVAAITVAADLLLVEQTDAVVLPPWYDAAIIAVSGFPIVVGLLAPASGARALRRLNGVSAVSHALLLVALWPALGFFPPGAPGGHLPWMLSVTGLAVIASVIAWGQAGGWVTLGALTLLLLGCRMALHDITPISNVNDHHTVITAMLMLVLCSALLRASRKLDVSAVETAAVATRRARERARRAAMVRTQALVHDDILATLVFAAQNSPLLNPAVAQAAGRIRSLIHDLAEGRVEERRSTAREFAAEAARITADADGAATFRWLPEATSPEESAAFVDPDAASTLLGALRQALVNSVGHAGPASSRTVTLTTDADEHWLRLVIADDGRGFDTRAVQGGRMGISASILARLDALPGGSARVDSRPGAGTLVAVEWRGDAAPPAANEEREPAWWEAGRRSFRLGVRVSVVVFLLVQLALAVNAATNAATPWLSMLTLAGVWLSVFTLGWGSIQRPSVNRSVATVAIVTATAALMLLLAAPGSMNYWDSWYLTACALVLFALALRGRVFLASAGLAALAIITVVGADGGYYAGTDLAISIARPVAIVAIGGAFALAIALLRAKIRTLQAESLRIVQQEAYESATRFERHDGAQRLEAQLGGMLARLEQLADPGAALTPAEAMECAALEGMLRDRYRGGRLATEPLTAAALSARRRGIDVVLLDDAVGEHVPPAVLAAVAEWMAERLDQARGGTVIGRLLPADRDGVASVVCEGSATLFRGRAARAEAPMVPRFEA